MNGPAAEHESEARAAAFWRSVHAGSPRAIAALLLVASNLAVFGALLWKGAGTFRASPELLLRFGANFAPATQDGEPWRLLSYMFLHYGVVHLGFNLWALWDAGRVVERLYGSLAFIGVYAFAGVCGGLASLWWNGPSAVSAGASAAVFGAYGALLGYVAVRRRAIPRDVLGGIAASAAVFVAFSFFIGALVGGVDNAAHLGGLTGGLTLGMLLAPSEATGRRHALQPLAGSVLAVAAVAGLWGLLPPPAYLHREQTAAEAAIRSFLDHEAETVRLARTVLDPLKRGEITPETAAQRLESEVVPKWDIAHRALAAVALAEAAPAAARLTLMRRYTAVRREMLAELAQGLRFDDGVRLEHANRLAGESHRLLDELQRLERRP